MAINKSWLNPANLPAPTQANFPALVHSFTPADIAADGLSITDPVGGVVISNPNGFVKSNGGFYTNPSTGWAFNKAFTSPASKALLLLGMGSMPLIESFLYGDPDIASGVGLGQNANTYAAKDASNYGTYVLTTATTPLIAQAVKVDIPNTAVHTFALGTGNSSVIVKTATITGSIAGPWGAMSIPSGSTTPFLTGSAFYLTGVFALLFDAAPSDVEIEGMVAWMAANPGYLPPSLLGRT